MAITFENEKILFDDKYGTAKEIDCFLPVHLTIGYELWNRYKQTKIDMGVIFLENAFRVLKENGRMAIVLSNSIASIDAHSDNINYYTRVFASGTRICLNILGVIIRHTKEIHNIERILVHTMRDRTGCQ